LSDFYQGSIADKAEDRRGFLRDKFIGGHGNHRVEWVTR
jgi:hypothetical protein